ncbi:MarR family winged helix-turn-helix transcriptional regulator [Streptomyces sp. NPDC059906]|uniref:MarR family winged helix-turn-helix transcriptional regulator n=1 Tax=Streptomyces sp. NPDC059906 TaxID=3346997 RepID=UPI003666A8B8
MALWDHGPQRQVDLVAAVETDAPTMARSIARLEKSGLVRRSASPDDRRAVIVEATEASLALRAKVVDAWADLERLTTTGLDTTEQAEILANLGLLESVLTEAGH